MIQFSNKYLRGYVNEFAVSYKNHPLDTIDELANMAIGKVGKRLRYADLIAPKWS